MSAMDSEEGEFAKFLREAAQLLTKFVVPIYENDRRGRPYDTTTIVFGFCRARSRISENY